MRTLETGNLTAAGSQWDLNLWGAVGHPIWTSARIGSFLLTGMGEVWWEGQPLEHGLKPQLPSQLRETPPVLNPQEVNARIWRLGS